VPPAADGHARPGEAGRAGEPRPRQGEGQGLRGGLPPVGPAQGSGQPQAASPDPRADGAKVLGAADPGGLKAKNIGAAAAQPQEEERRPPSDDGERRNQTFASTRTAGQESDHAQETRRSAREEFAHAAHAGAVNGDMIQGDKITLNMPGVGRSISLVRLSARQLEDAYEETSEYDNLVRCIRRARVALVRGPEGFGKTMLTARALRPDHPQGAVFKLDGSTDPGDLNLREHVAPGSAVLWSDVSEGWLAKLTEHTVLSWANDCDDLHVHVAIAVKDQQPLQDLARWVDEVVQIRERPDARRVVRRHLLRLQPTALDLLERKDVAQVVDRELAEQPSPAHAAWIARLLAQDAHMPSEVARRVEERLRTRNKETRLDWFARLPDLRSRCFAIALAVLNRLPQEYVSLAADDLCDHLEPPREPLTLAPAPPRDPFGTSRSGLLALLCAEATHRTDWQTPHGTVPVTVLLYQDPSMPRDLLDHVWEEFHQVRPDLLAWLGRLAADDSLHVRTRAAMALGVFAEHAFDQIKHQVIDAWAKDDQAHRDNAALALSVPATTDAFRDVVGSVVAGWAADENERLQACAARAYGSSLGLEDPGASLRGLRRLAVTDSADVAVAVSLSVAELVTETPPVVATRVLAELEAWMRAPSAQERFVGALAAWGLMDRYTSEWDAEGRRQRMWPTLFRLADRSAALCAQVAALLHCGLNGQEYQAFADALDDWARAMDPDAEGRNLLSRLLAATASDVRTRRILGRRAQLWAGRTGQSPLTGNAVLAALV
jgi:hypothetical protein